jgi:hypothetical protein
MQHPLHIDHEHNTTIRAEIGQRLGIILSLGNRPKLPVRVRHLLDRLAEQDHEMEMETSPSIVPSENEGWVRRLARRFR